MADLAGFKIERRGDGVTLLCATGELPPYPRRVTDRLVHWAETTPEVTFLAEPSTDGWRRLTYAAALCQVRAIGQALLDRGLSSERPVLILSGNGIEHALLALACQHVGVLYAPISAAYSGANSDLVKLRQIVALTTPGLVFARGAGFRRALDAVVPPGCEAIDSLDDLLATAPTEAVETAQAAIDGDTVAKLLFTSGSTGTRPKAVITTHRMLCANQSMMHLGFGYLLGDEKPIMVDWLPWSHTFGGSHNFNMVLFAGGTMYLDVGRPLPGQFGPTLEAIREVAPTLYLAVPKAWEELARAMRADPALNRRFHERLRVRFYAAAALSQPLWDELDALAAEATDHELPMITGLGSTETAPMGTCTDGTRAGRAGDIGMPVPGITLKMVPTDGKLELRVSGPCITPGYWRDPEKTAAAFDDEGFYCMGDAVAWIDPLDPARGLRFDGRLAEDFKLMSGTWVSVGPLRARLIAAMAPWVRDVVIAGHDRDEVTALLLPFDPKYASDPAVRTALTDVLGELAATAAGSSARVVRVAFLAGPLSLNAGEVTDKGSVNQAAVLRCRPDEVTALYADPPPPQVMCAVQQKQRITA